MTTLLRAGALVVLGVVGVLLLPGRNGRASSVAMVTISFNQAVKQSGRIVKGTVAARRDVKVDGAALHAVDVTIDAVLKGAPARAGDRVTTFDPQAWFRHTHAAAIRGGVVSYVDARYATPLPDAELKPGAAVIVFLQGDAPPAGFPPDAAFLISPGAFERAQRAGDVARVKVADFGKPIRLAKGDIAVFPSGLEIEVKAHSHKRPMVGGPSKEMAELAVGLGKSELVTLGHVIDADGTQTWEKKLWNKTYEIELAGMTYDTDTTLRVRQLPAAPTPPAP
jgi:hypothetical protein